jgi:hypothetical protein
MPAWIHGRAEHILAKNPSMPKSEAFAIATQQSHAVGKSPKGYGTAQGRETAHEKYKTPGDDKKTANPGKLSSPKMEKKGMDPGLMSSLKGVAGAGPRLGGQLTNAGQPLSRLASTQVKSMAQRGTLLQNVPKAPAFEADPFGKAASAFFDELRKIAAATVSVQQPAQAAPSLAQAAPAASAAAPRAMPPMPQPPMNNILFSPKGRPSMMPQPGAR